MSKRQNTSHAVMAQRAEAADSLDDFPTPPWATRALLEHVVSKKGGLKQLSCCLEPACGAGHMAKVLAEYIGTVYASDVHDYGYGAVADFVAKSKKHLATVPPAVDWIITNPPFRLAEDFLEVALLRARVGVALLTRTVFIESVGRYERIFKHNPPTRFAQFTERVRWLKDVWIRKRRRPRDMDGSSGKRVKRKRLSLHGCRRAEKFLSARATTTRLLL